MNDEPRGAGPSGGSTPHRSAELAGHGGPRVTTAKQIAEDERALIAHFHLDAADILDALRGRSEAVGRLVEAFGPDDCREIRVELRRLTRLTVRLLDTQFADL